MGYYNLNEFEQELLDETISIADLADGYVGDIERQDERFFEIANTNNMEEGAWGNQTREKQTLIAKNVVAEREAQRGFWGKTGSKVSKYAVMGAAIFTVLAGAFNEADAKGRSASRSSGGRTGSTMSARGGLGGGGYHGGGASSQSSKTEVVMYNGQQITLFRAANHEQGIGNALGGTLYYQVRERETITNEKGKEKKVRIYYVKDKNGNVTRIGENKQIDAAIDAAGAQIQSGAKLTTPVTASAERYATPSMGGNPNGITQEQYNQIMSEIDKLWKYSKKAHNKADTANAKLGRMQKDIASLEYGYTAITQDMAEYDGKFDGLEKAQSKIQAAIDELYENGVDAFKYLGGAILVLLASLGIERAYRRKGDKQEAQARQEGDAKVTDEVTAIKSKLTSFKLKNEEGQELTFDDIQ